MRIRVSLLALAIAGAVAALTGCGAGGRSTASTTINDQLFTPNYVSSLSGNLFHWGHLPMRVSFAIPGSWSGTEWDDPSAYAAAAEAWNQPGKQAFTTVVPFGSTADVVVQFVTRADFASKPPQTMGDTQVIYDATGLLHSAVVRVTRENPYGGYCSLGRLQVTIAHELGHALGILGHSPSEDDLMYPSKGEGASCMPTVRDLNTAMTAYPSYFTTRPGIKPPAETVPAAPLRAMTIE